MRINSVQPKTHFKSIYKVQVPKDLFLNPSNSLECVQDFENNIFPAVGELIGCKGRFCSFIESAGYQYALNELNDDGLGYCSVDWLNRNTESNIKLPESEDNHTFYVFTDKDLKKIFKKNSFSFVKLYLFLRKIKKEIKQNQIPEDKSIDFLFKAKIAEAADRKMYEVIGDSSVTVLDLESGNIEEK